MVQLIGGFSPRNFVKQVGSVVNPTGGVANYDVFTNVGNQRTPQAQEGLTSLRQPNPNDYKVDYNALVNSGALTRQDGGGNVQGTNTGNYGGGGGYTPPPDPYALWGGAEKYNALRSGFGAQKQGIYGSANEAAANAGLGLKGSILDFVDSLRTGQRSIDNKGINNELAKRQGTQNILGMVGRGIRSSGVQLANRNAGDSSAAGALANAYGEVGRGQLTGVGNQYEMGNRDIAMDQDNLAQQMASGQRKIGDSKTQVVNNIVADARNKFAQLDSEIANASLPDRIAIEQEKETIRQQVLGQLQQYDQMLASETAQIAPSSAEARRTEATRLAGLGQAPADAFTYTDEVPGQWQDTGPFPSEIPLFMPSRGRRLA